MLKIAVGYGTKPIQAKERAIFFYEKSEGKKVFKAVETQPGFNELEESVWITTIWYELLLPEEKIEEKPTFIGSTDINPNDPNWYEKWKTLQANANDQPQEETETMTHIADR